MIEKILVVDDDFLIRKWLCLLIQQSPRCHADILQAENGQKALDILGQERIDLVVTDIDMPLVNGVELVQKINRMKRAPQVAVLSAYDDYQYVRATLREGVLDYLLKDEIELHDIDTLLEIAEQVSEKGPAPDIAIAEQENFLRISRMFAECVEGPDPDLQSFFEQAAHQKLTFPIDCLTCRFEQLPTTILPDYLYSQLYRSCKDQVLDCLAFPYKSNLLFLLHCRKDPVETLYFTESRIQQIRKIMEVGSNGCHLAGMELQYVQERNQLSPAIMGQLENTWRTNFYALRQLPETLSQSQELDLLADYKSEISAAVQKRQYISARNLFQEMATKCSEHAISPSLFISSCIAVCHQMSAYIHTFMANAHLALVENAVSQLQRAESVQVCTDIILKLMDYIQEAIHKHPMYSSAIEKSIDYISSHYAEKLTLERVSSHVYLNRSYFSELFKRETGINYNDYINQVRIQKACELMEDHRHSLSDIAQLVGYSDQNYFSKIFKRLVGESPKTYQKKVIAASESLKK